MSETFGALGDWLLKAHGAINLIATLLIVVPGVALWFIKPRALEATPKRIHALELWLAHWIPLIPVYFLLKLPAASFFTGDQNIYDWIILTLLDIQSLLLLGFGYAIVKGADLDTSRTWKAIGFAAAVVAFYNVCLYQFPLPSKESFSRYFYALPSASLSSIAFISFGYSFLIRWGAVALPVLIVSFIYALIQWPIYINAVVLGNPDARWYVVLACAKLLLGAIFYLFFTAPLQNYDAVPVMQTDIQAKKHILSTMKSVWAAVGAVIVATIATAISSLVAN